MTAWEIALWVVVFNWVAPLLMWLYPLAMLLRGDFVFDGFYGVWAKFRKERELALPPCFSRRLSSS